MADLRILMNMLSGRYRWIWVIVFCIIDKAMSLPLVLKETKDRYVHFNLIDQTIFFSYNPILRRM